MSSADKASPFADPPRAGSSTRRAPTSQSQENMKEAIKDVISIRPVDPSPRYPLPRSNTFNTISTTTTFDEPVPKSSTSRRAEGGRERANSTPRGASSKSKAIAEEQNAKKGSPSKPKKDAPLDIIDRLDISGLYSGGALHRHDGPYAAATAARNKGPRAPIAAFDPSALALAGAGNSSATPRPHANLSARAMATLAAMEESSGSGGNGGPYPSMPGSSSAAGPRRKPLGRRASDSSVTMGFPSSAANGKGQQLIEMYGVRDSEAWEDFGTSRYAGDTGSHASSKEDLAAGGNGRVSRTNSIWDIEATLRAGRPIGQASPPVPILPVLPIHPVYSNSLAPPTDNKPKRSKSLVARFRGAGRRNDDEASEARTPPREPGTPTRELESGQKPLDVRRDESGRFVVDSSSATILPTSTTTTPATTGIRFKDDLPAPPPPPPARRTTSDSNPRDGETTGSGGDRQGEREKAVPELPKRRPSVLQRLFSSKAR